MLYPYLQKLTLFIFCFATYNGTWPHSKNEMNSQKRPYLHKFEAPEGLDRCIRILVSRRIFLAIVQNRLILTCCTTKTADILGLQNYKKRYIGSEKFKED